MKPLVSLLLLGLAAAAPTPAQPTIKRTGNDFTLTMPEPMWAALKALNPDFKPWTAQDYSPEILKEDKEYPRAGNSAPFAMIVDVNGDKRPDVVIDGRDKKSDLLLGIVSSKEGYTAQVIERGHSLSVPSKIVNEFRGKKERGLCYFLSPSDATEKGGSIFSIIVPQQSEANDELINDGYMRSFLFQNGKFVEEEAQGA